MGDLHHGRGYKAYRRKRAALKRRVEREGLVCWLCGEEIDLTLPARDRMSFTADHVDALANGGHITKNELRPAHMSCNSRRGNNADAEIWEAS